MKELSVLEWNIHQQGGRGRGNIPPWVKDEINGFDIITLTEFCTECDGRTAFITDLEQLGYRCVASENSRGNDILIAAKSCFPVLNDSWLPCDGEDSLPENLRVDIDVGGSVLTVVGIRIKSLNNRPNPKNGIDEINQSRRKELQRVLEQIKDIKNPILMTGDFNNNKRRSDYPIWSMSVMEEMLKKEGFILYTPEGSSMFEEKPHYNEFPYDHFAVRGAEITLLSYDRDFTKRDTSAYFLGRDFCEPWYPGAPRNLPAVTPPFPDHAILKGTLLF